jgi:pteridine reductase
MSSQYLIGLGSNVDPHRNMPSALKRLQTIFGSIEVSRIRDTAPVGPMRSRFLNAVALIQTRTTPDPLKALFCELETEFGRNRPYLRPSALELIHVLGFDCTVPAVMIDDATSVSVEGEQIGLTPVRIEQGLPGSSVLVVKRHAALITGGAVRLGREIALSLAKAGYDIALHYHSSDREAELTAELCRANGVRCEMFKGDFQHPQCLPGLMGAVVSRFPHLDLLVNSASLYEAGSISQTTAEMLDRQWSVNFKAPLLLMKEFAAQVGRGTIINVIDNKIAFNQFQYAAYLTAKKALAEVTKMAALEFAPRIRVNGIAPGVIMPSAERGQAYLQWRAEAIPVARLGNPQLLCQGLMCLISNDFINGQILFVDGGESASFTGRNAPAFHDNRSVPTSVNVG